MQYTLENYPGIRRLADIVRELKKDANVKAVVDERMKEFRNVHKMDSHKWYEELVYCLLTAYSSALIGQRCLDALCKEDTLMDGSLNDVEECLKAEGHRFANRRAEYIFNTRYLARGIKEKIQGFDDSRSARYWLVENIKGIGFKESSHYLRNVGYFDLAILDRHIIRNMADFNLVDKVEAEKGLSKKRYLQYEKILSKVAKDLVMPLGEMDLYLWYRKTGKILK